MPSRERTTDLADVTQVAIPIPGLIAILSVSVDTKVAKEAKPLMMEAMKIQNTVCTPSDGLGPSQGVNPLFAIRPRGQLRRASVRAYLARLE